MREYDEIIKLDLGLKEENKKEVIEIIKSLLPDNATIILLSHTGSRAFGWSWYNYDFDIHGIIKCTNYWDFMHLGKSAYDINIYELSHIVDIDIPYRHTETLMNMLNPFYLDDKFPFDDFVKVLTPSFFTESMILQQIERFKFDRHPRSALHSYRIILVPLYLLLKGKPELNVFKIAKELKMELKGLVMCRNRYIAKYVGERRSTLTEDEFMEVLDELCRLLDYFIHVKGEKEKETKDRDLAKEFKEKIMSIYYS